jgi:hypothetical protein
VVKIYNVSQFESANPDSANTIDCIGLLNLDALNNVIHIGLNCLETHLFVVSSRKSNNNSYQYNLDILEMESIAFNQNKNSQVRIKFKFIIWSFFLNNYQFQS